MTETKRGLPGVQGWQNFLTSRTGMLDAYDRAKQTNQSKPVAVGHGVAAESAVREWLTEFLPRRYGVAQGYIVSWMLSEDDHLHHYDVIIYDALESPTLWIEKHGGDSVRAIPAEHVLAVLEVKASLTRRSAQQAMKKLRELEPFLSAIDLPDARHPAFFPLNFFSAIIFFEIGEQSAQHRDILTTILPDDTMRGFFGGIVMRSMAEPETHSGRISFVSWDVQNGEKKTLKTGDIELMDKCPPLDRAISISHGRLIDGGLLTTQLSWRPEAFAQFSFDVLAQLAGRYQAGTLSSWHGYILSPTAALRHNREARATRGKGPPGGE